ncbi:zonular occludens toxin family protein [Xanthomonas citri]|uniref:Zonular occludens toxin n=2 Tax=root TaxID=1 RepID=A0A9E6FZX9_9VIRU|nr:zonular occludens toxin domain-containing protein [Xanthomonas citri]YP_010768569.1 zonular occludens toxin [Xanthomonas phage Cf2]AGI07373.1 filamentous phage phiLf protein [Xanthomonas citri subsp. citri Aw12879]AJZ43760.1 Zonula occludens toxin [Xanthomonas citri pv. citri]AJZ48378.1 Zonula occludens toxin [Xanthomonas citri pv. citri]AJZ52996.1 Zonula occludens toxin [Xanthomonas citri pv. citri]AJZ65791.1 Zonula occludens toxin [Xanthomonas citri pv. citri]
MLVFNEGVPRAGKSYDAVKNHILPAIKKGRRVFARLNGLRHDRIAKHLGMEEKDVQHCLVLVDTKDVAKLFACTQDASGKWCIPDEFKDALVVIDEVHEFYVNERKPLEPAVENFWALLGQNGGDAVIMTQWINRLHSAVKARIEKKNTFQKLTAVGMKSRYRVTYFHTTSPGKFEKVGGQTLKYDPVIFPLYDGYAPGAENTEVYEEGGKNVWAAMAVRAVIFLVVGGVGLYFFAGFFSKGKQETHKPAAAGATVWQQSDKASVGAGLANGAPSGAVQAPPPDPLADLTDEQRYVAQLAEKGRIRLAARARVGSDERAWVHWIDTSNNVIEQLDIDQLRALGYSVTMVPYGMRLVAGKHVLVATPWPWREPVREQDPRLYNTASDGKSDGAAGVATAGSDAGGADRDHQRSAVIGHVPRSLGTFPESKPYQTTTSTPATTLDM